MTSQGTMKNVTELEIGKRVVEHFGLEKGGSVEEVKQRDGNLLYRRPEAPDTWDGLFDARSLEPGCRILSCQLPDGTILFSRPDQGAPKP